MWEPKVRQDMKAGTILQYILHPKMSTMKITKPISELVAGKI